MEAIVKATIVTIIAGGALVAALYLAYVFLFVLVLGLIGFGAHYYFKNKDKLFDKWDFPD